MVGKHPLYVVVSVFQKLVVFEFLLQLCQVHALPDFLLIFVEHVVGQLLTNHSLQLVSLIVLELLFECF